MEGIIYASKRVSATEFVEFWSPQYQYPQESHYTANIGKPLTPERLRQLFVWKNGMRLSERKRRSLESNYIMRLREITELPETMDPSIFIDRFCQQGAIWGIFLLHCWQPDGYPIYDQHVHRAMRFIQDYIVEEIAGWSDRRKTEAYLNEYLPFYRSFAVQDGRMLDKALWVFGKFLSRSRFPDVAGYRAAVTPKRS